MSTHSSRIPETPQGETFRIPGQDATTKHHKKHHKNHHKERLKEKDGSDKSGRPASWRVQEKGNVHGLARKPGVKAFWKTGFDVEESVVTHPKFQPNYALPGKGGKLVGDDGKPVEVKFGDVCEVM